MHLNFACKKLTEYEYHDVLFNCNCSYWSAWAVIISVIYIINSIISIPVPWISVVFVVEIGIVFMSPGKLIRNIHILVFFKSMLKFIYRNFSNDVAFSIRTFHPKIDQFQTLCAKLHHSCFLLQLLPLYNLSLSIHWLYLSWK